MLQIRNLTMTYQKDQRTLLRDFNLTLNREDCAVIIGEEGNGKSTLLKYLVDPKLVESYCDVSGLVSNVNEVIGYLPQMLPDQYRDTSLYEFFLEEERFPDLTPGELNEIARETGLSIEMFYGMQLMGTLSGGEKIKAQMARILMHAPTMLLLDEPSNDLDLETLQWLENFLQETDCGVLYISHDEVLIEHTANRIIHLELLHRKTECRYTIANVTYAEYVERRGNLFDRQMQQAISERRQDRIRMEKYQRIQQKVEYRQRTITRQDAHGGQLLKKKMHAVKSMERRFDKMREDMTEIPEQEEAIMVEFPESVEMPKGKMVLDFSLDHLEAADQSRELAKNIELHVNGPEKICIIGNNGSGKTTLLKKIAEELLHREDLKAAYMPQSYEDLLDMEKTPIAYLAPDNDTETVTKVRQYLGSMRYTTDEMTHSMKDLSGGQKAKVLLLKMVLDGADVLILDEPTRNFSPLSSPVIRHMLYTYKGAIISVSHDRKYIEEVPDRVYELTHEGLKELV